MHTLPVQLPVFDQSYADCHTCDMKSSCDAGLSVTSLVPEKWNGIMVVGDSPGQSDVTYGRPFHGPSGNLLKALFDSYGYNLDECYLASAVLCRQPKQSAPNGKAADGKAGLHERFPNAIYSCLPRLEAEIAAVRPRVIIALGATALIALTGYEDRRTVRTPFTCDNCDEDRKIGPVVECSSRKSGEPCHKRYWADEVPEDCGKCGSSLRKAKPKRIKCPVCKGLKTRPEERVDWEYDYKISEVAGAVIDDKQHSWGAFGVKYIVPTMHPSFLLRGEKAQFMAKAVQKHLRKAFFLRDNDRDWNFEYEVTSENGDADDARILLDYIYREHDTSDFVAVDIETSAIHVDDDGDETELDARKVALVTDINVIGFCSKSAKYALVVDTRKTSAKLLDALQRVLTDTQVKKVFHHGNYDCPVINKVLGFKVQGYVGDTLQQHHVLYPDEPHKLSHVTFSFTYARIWKPPRNLHGREAHESFEELCKYNGRDVNNTIENFEVMSEALVRKKLDHIYQFDILELQQQALAMHYNGMAVSTESIRTIGDAALEKQQRGLETMRDILKNKDFNPNKNAELADALYNRIGYQCNVFTKGKVDKTSQQRIPGMSTAKEVIAQLADTPFKHALVLYREGTAVLRNFFEVSEEEMEDGYIDRVPQPAKSFFIWNDGRLHFLWKAFGTRTGRYSSNPNAQNFPKWLRAAIIAPPGRVLIGADEDQLEMRITAALCGDKNLINRCLGADSKRKLEPEWDPHSYVASIAFEKSFMKLDIGDPRHDMLDEQCRCQKCQRSALREICKRVFYGMNYGAGDAKVLEAIYNGGYQGPAITMNMVATSRKAIFKGFPDIGPWRERKIKLAIEEQELRSPILGRRRHFPLGEIPITEILNFDVQAGGADIVNMQSTKVYHGMPAVDASALYEAQVHDAVYYEADEKKSDQVCDFITKTLTCELTLCKGGAPMVFSAKAKKGKNWFEVS